LSGNPAKEIKKRNNPETIEKLLKIKWWNWSLKRIKENMDLLLSDRIDESIAKNMENNIKNP
jgi:hypothetical protein